MQETHYGRKKKRMMAPPAMKKRKRRGGKAKKGKEMSREQRIKMGEDALGDQPF